MDKYYADGDGRDGPPTPKQIEVLKQILPRNVRHWIGGLTREGADIAIRMYSDRWSMLPPTPRQVWFLRRHGLWSEGMTRGRASELIALAKSRDGRGHR
jgi:hypothetical protein